MDNTYSTIKELVIEACISEGEFPPYEKLTSIVLRHFPSSKWQKTHYAWYKSKIKTGAISVPGFIGEANTPNADDEGNDVEETIDASLSLERDLHTYLSNRVNEIESGLELAEHGVEFTTDAGRIDILALDAQRNQVVIELKVGKAKDSALGQILGYMGCIASDPTMGTTEVRGILVASSFEHRVIYAAKSLPNVKLVKYKVSFDLEEVV
jgi:endonuclease